MKDGGRLIRPPHGRGLVLVRFNHAPLPPDRHAGPRAGRHRPVHAERPRRVPPVPMPGGPGAGPAPHPDRAAPGPLEPPPPRLLAGVAGVLEADPLAVARQAASVGDAHRGWFAWLLV